MICSLVVLRKVQIFIAWIRALFDLVDKFYKNETRDNVRLKALSVLMDTYKCKRHKTFFFVTDGISKQATMFDLGRFFRTFLYFLLRLGIYPKKESSDLTCKD